jgi:TonB family protein
MSWFNFNYILQAYILLIALISVYHFLLKKETHFRFNRVYLLMIGFVSLIIPLFDIPIVNTSIVNLTYSEASNATTQNIAGTINSHEPDLWSMISTKFTFLYLSISSLLLLLFLIKIVRINKKVNSIKHRAQFYYLHSIYVCSEKIEPFTFFNDSFIPQTIMDSEDSELIISHERTHAKEKHSVDIIIAEIINCLLFLNPLQKVFLKHISENHEYLADAKVTQKKLNKRYTSLLIKLTLKREGLQIVSFFAKPSILNRIDMMKRTKKSRTNQIIASIFSLMLVSLFACDFQEEEMVIKDVTVDDSRRNLSSEELKDRVFQIVEDQAEPTAGIQNFYDNIGDFLNGKYPEAAQNMGIEGVVFIQFIVEKDGSLSNIQPVKGIGGGCDELAVKAVESVDKWKPGMQNGQVVRSQRVIPIRFTLKSDFLQN